VLSSLIPSFIIVVKELETFSEAIQGKIKVLIAPSDAQLIVSKGKLMDLLRDRQLLNGYHLGTA
jgi:hypothetical protein